MGIPRYSTFTFAGSMFNTPGQSYYILNEVDLKGANKGGTDYIQFFKPGTTKINEPVQPAVKPPKSAALVKFKPTIKPEKTANVVPPEIEQAKRFEFFHKINPRIVGDHELFHNECDVMICDILVAQPGERCIGIELDKNFDTRFLEDVKQPIPEHVNDTEDDKALKAAVTQMREQLLSDLNDKGLSPREAIQQARDDLNKIADYRDLIEQELANVAEKENEEYCDQFVAEANKLLDEYGAFHVKLGKKTRARIRERMSTQVDAAKPPSGGSTESAPTIQE